MSEKTKVMKIELTAQDPLRHGATSLHTFLLELIINIKDIHQLKCTDPYLRRKDTAQSQSNQC